MKQPDLLKKIIRYCELKEMPESTFGRLAVADGSLVADLRTGRSLTMRTVEKVEKFMSANK